MICTLQAGSSDQFQIIRRSPLVAVANLLQGDDLSVPLAFVSDDYQDPANLTGYTFLLTIDWLYRRRDAYPDDFFIQGGLYKGLYFQKLSGDPTGKITFTSAGFGASSLPWPPPWCRLGGGLPCPTLPAGSLSLEVKCWNQSGIRTTQLTGTLIVKPSATHQSGALG